MSLTGSFSSECLSAKVILAFSERSSIRLRTRGGPGDIRDLRKQLEPLSNPIRRDALNTLQRVSSRWGSLQHMVLLRLVSVVCDTIGLTKQEHGGTVSAQRDRRSC